MNNMGGASRVKMLGYFLAGFAVIAGIVLRVYDLRGSGFFFYDEGLYLNHNRAILEFIQSHSPLSRADSWKAFTYYAKLALASGKSLWFFIVDSRFLWGALKDWEFGKVMACFFGLLTLPLFYKFVHRFSGSTAQALLAVAILALLPGHVYYSRIGLQEALSIFLVLAGFYFYLFPRKFGWRSLASGLLLGAAFFANYRLCMLPVLVGVAEIWLAISEGRRFDWRRYTWSMVAFLSCVVIIGNLFDGANTVTIFAWVFHQGDTAKDVFAWVNLLSYPYYLFRLESWGLALFFFGNLYFVYKKKWDILLPFVLVCVQMGIFSLTNEKGLRYIAVVLPFFVLSASYAIKALYEVATGIQRKVLLAVCALIFVLLAGQSVRVAQAGSDCEKLVRYLEEKDPAVKFLASQDLVMSLYTSSAQSVKPLPASFEQLIAMYSKGYRYLVLGPQSYVDNGTGGRFLLPLRDYLVFFDGKLEPVKVFPHLNYEITERFVFEHSTNLVDSIRFLASADIKKYSSLRVYDLASSVPAMIRIAEHLKKR